MNNLVREVRELRIQNESLNDRANRCVNLERKVRDLNYEVSDLQKQISLQNDAIEKARELKCKTDMILEDYSKCKTELDQMLIHNDKINFEY